MPELSETFKHLKDDPQGGSQHLLTLLESFLLPFLHVLDEALDKRLVRTFLQCLVAIIRGRNNAQVLWLSELGSYLDGYGAEACSAAAGTKRVGKLLRSVKWTADLIEWYLLEKADEEVQKLKVLKQRILCIWDDSVVEKAESEKGEGLGPVLDSQSQAAWTDQTWGGLQLARPTPGAGHRNAMDGSSDCRDARTPAPGSEPLVDNQRGVCHPVARYPRRSLTSVSQEMGTPAGSCV